MTSQDGKNIKLPTLDSKRQFYYFVLSNSLDVTIYRYDLRTMTYSDYCKLTSLFHIYHLQVDETQDNVLYALMSDYNMQVSLYRIDFAQEQATKLITLRNDGSRFVFGDAAFDAQAQVWHVLTEQQEQVRLLSIHVQQGKILSNVSVAEDRIHNLVFDTGMQQLIATVWNGDPLQPTSVQFWTLVKGKLQTNLNLTLDAGMQPRNLLLDGNSNLYSFALGATDEYLLAWNLQSKQEVLRKNYQQAYHSLCQLFVE